MKKSFHAAFFMTIFFLNIFQKTISADISEDTTIIKMSQSTETINNPGAGYTTIISMRSKPGVTNIYNPVGNLCLFFICLSGFSSGQNGQTQNGTYIEGEDYDLDEVFFNGLRQNFENVRRNGGTIGLRFRYDENGNGNPEPSTFDKVLSHMEQIKESGILEEFKDILMFVESGFVGCWGEQHGGKYCSLEYKAQVLEAVLNMTPDDIPVTTRIPIVFAAWVGIPMGEIDSYISKKGTKEARVGTYNDGYMGSNTDLGTYANRLKETNWMKNQNRYTYFGGEFSGNLDWAKKYDTYLPENAIPEMYKTHLSYINGNIYALYRDYEYGIKYAVDGANNEAYYGQTVWKFIRDHLGYRFVLRESEINNQIEQGGTINIRLKIENTGFANPIKNQKAEIILEKDGNYYKTEVDVDSTEFFSCETHEVNLAMKAPGGIEIGVWNIYFKLSVGKSNVNDFYMRSVKFANNNIWNGGLGANKIGTVTIVKSTNKSLLSEFHFYQSNAKTTINKSDGNLLTINNNIIIDGAKTGYSEWTSNNLLNSNNGLEIYVTNDDNYLYIMADIEQTASSPVVNLRLNNLDTGITYWLYYQSNGFVYFNKGTCTGCIFKRNENISEFKIPFGDVMGLKAGTVIKTISVFIQDSDNGWVGAGGIESGQYIVSKTFPVFSAYRNLYLKEHDDYTLKVETILNSPKYQWYLNDEIIQGANASQYAIKNASASNKGIYSVKVTSSNGIEKTSLICNLLDVYS